MLDWTVLLATASIYLVGVIIPGPNFIAISHCASASSRTRALAMVCGIVLVNLGWAAAAVLGIGAVFAAAPWLALGVKLFGAAYLIWIGVSLLRGGKTPGHRAAKAAPSAWQAFRTGITVNALNPKSAAFYAATFSAVAPPNVGAATLIGMLAVVMVIAFTWYGAVALLLSQPAVAREIQARRAAFDRVCGALLVALGLRQAASA